VTSTILDRTPGVHWHPGNAPIRVAIVHDYLTQRGGAERVVLSMTRAFPGATVHTTLYEPDETYPEFRDVDVRVSSLNNIPLLRNDHRIAMPLLPRALRKIEVGDVDIVLASSSGWAHGVHADVPVVVYCHNPPRWLHQAEDYTKGLSLPNRLILKALTPRLRHWDQWAAKRADRYVVNSRPVRERVFRAYGIDADVVPPPVAFDPGGRQTRVAGIEPGYLLTVGRNRGYKATREVADAVRTLPHERLVIVGDAPPGI
jgi:glycosyltransferase involved in cell wall biosynthesis